MHARIPAPGSQLSKGIDSMQIGSFPPSVQRHKAELYQEEENRRFGGQLNLYLKEGQLEVDAQSRYAAAAKIVMNTAILLEHGRDQPAKPLQVVFDLVRRDISLACDGKIEELKGFNLQRYAFPTYIELQRVQKRLLEENAIGVKAVNAVRDRVLSGSFHSTMGPDSRVMPNKLASGGYEFRLSADGEKTLADGSALKLKGIVSLQTDQRGVPLCFVTAIEGEERILAGSKGCSGPATVYITDKSAQDSLKQALRGMFPEQYARMGV